MLRLGVGSVHTFYGKEDSKEGIFCISWASSPLSVVETVQGAAEHSMCTAARKVYLLKVQLGFYLQLLKKKKDNLSKVAAKQFITGELCFKNQATSVYLVASGCDKSPNLSFRVGCCFPLCPLLVFFYQLTPQTDYCSESR